MDQNGYQHQMDIQFGNTSKVTVAKTVTGDLVAIKSIPKSFVVQLYRQSATKLNLVKDEVTAMSTISSPWLVALYDVFQTHDQIHLVQEFCSQGDLFTYLMHREVLLFDLEYDLIVRQMVVCVQELHRHGFMHRYAILIRDIKPMNFFLDSQGIKLGDFGSAIAVNPGQKLLDWSVGTDGFIAPEIENELPYGYEVDFYSLGVCIRDLFDFLNYLRSERDLDLYEKSYYLEELIEQVALANVAY
jgi:serine/threonine protein kinase